MTYRTWLKRYEKLSHWPEHAHIVSVAWDDATYAQEIEDSGLARAVTLGIVVEATPDYVKLASEFFTDASVRDVSTIPSGMIVEIRPIGDTEVRKSEPKPKPKRR